MADAAINVGIVGYGLAGKVFHAPLVRATPGLRLAAIVSSDAAKVHADIPDVAVVGKYAVLLADPAIDLVVIATPDALHAEQAIAALDAGKHVVIDKPFAPTLAEARTVAARAARGDRLLSIFHSRRWDGDFLTLRRLIDDGALGEIVQFESHYDRYRPAVADRWKERRGAGVWQDLGPHLVDQALRLFGPPRAVWADIDGQRQGALAPDYVHVVLRYDRLRVILHASHLTHANTLRYAVHGTGGSFVKHGMDVQESQSRLGMIPGEAGWGVDPAPGTLVRIGADGVAISADVAGVPGDYRAYYAALREAIAGRGPNPVTADEGLAVMAVLDLASRSAAERRELAFG